MNPNHLNNEKSPYLLQHANQPVHWYPWGEAAFQKAKEEDKPVFLSIGYSTCHWCHVMAHESFEDKEIARFLNEHFISVKVDREERPDIDSVYMSVCHSMTGQGGWPLTIIMTPECKPFFAATYLPPKAAYGRNGLDTVLKAVTLQWKENRERLLAAGEQICSFLQNQEQNIEKAHPSKALLQQAYVQLKESFDPENGGFGTAPKFPSPHSLLFLLRYGKKEPEALKTTVDMVETTLDQMYRGGIYDHIGGGFSRYSTDSKWLVPHFEKMLYDNALLAMAYTEGYLATGKTLYKKALTEIFEYVLRELTGREGGFYSSQDADSEGVEGKYYVFTPEEIYKCLGREQGKEFCHFFGISGRGNFEGKNIANLLNNPDYESADKKSREIDKMKESVRKFRLGRTRLHKDDKILTAWNGLMIAAFSNAYGVLGIPAWLDAAEKAEQFLSENLLKDGRLLVRYRDGEAAGEGKLDDYAFYIFGLLSLYQVTYKTSYLKKAVSLAEVMLEQFFDPENGGFYIYARDGEQLIIKTKEAYDGAIPSGNSVAAFIMERLYKLTGEGKWREWSEIQSQYLAGVIRRYPAGYCFSLLAFMQNIYPTKELIALNPSEEDYKTLRQMAVRDPGLSILVLTQENKAEMEELAPFTRAYQLPAEGSLYYWCEGSQCRAGEEELKGTV